MKDGKTANRAWFDACSAVVNKGERVAPRSKPTRELLHQTHIIDMLFPVVAYPERKLNYQFMAAEALWILKGQNVLSELVRYNSKMAEFSDDGVILAGAYGPRIHAGLDYIVKTLIADAASRQATLTIWTPNPQPSKDIPCTIAMDFKIRDDLLHTGVFMRASDVWLGLPYDIFAFSCVTYLVTIYLRDVYPDLAPGLLYLTAASSHLYDTNLLAFDTVAEIAPSPTEKPVPVDLWRSRDALFDTLTKLRETRKGDPLRWWE